MQLPFALQKLKIFQLNPENHNEKLGKFEVMFNPQSYKETYGVQTNKTVQADGSLQYHFTGSQNNAMDIKLVIDSSYAHKYLWNRPRKLPLRESVQERINRLLMLAGYQTAQGITPELISPQPLMLEWGRLKYTCILESISIDYNQFDRDGQPTLATLDCKFLSLDSLNQQAEEEKASTVDHSGEPVANFTITLRA